MIFKNFFEENKKIHRKFDAKLLIINLVNLFKLCIFQNLNFVGN